MVGVPSSPILADAVIVVPDLGAGEKSATARVEEECRPAIAQLLLAGEGAVVPCVLAVAMVIPSEVPGDEGSVVRVPSTARNLSPRGQPIVEMVLPSISSEIQCVTPPLLPRANPRVSAGRLPNSRQGSIQSNINLEVTNQ